MLKMKYLEVSGLPVYPDILFRYSEFVPENLKINLSLFNYRHFAVTRVFFFFWNFRYKISE